MRTGRGYLFLVIVFLAGLSISFSQNNDSIFAVLSAEKEDTNKVNDLNAFTRQLVITADFAAAIPPARQALNLADKLNFKKGKAVAYTMLGIIYFGFGSYPESLKNHYAGLKIREELGDQKAIAATYHNIANAYYSQNNVEEAMKNYFKSLEIKRKLNDTMDTHYAHTLNNIANYYKDKGNTAKALELYSVSIKIEEQLKDMSGLISAKNNVANIYMNRGDYSVAEKIYFECLGIEEEIGDKAAIAAINLSIGSLYITQQLWKKAEIYVNTGLQQAIEIESKDDIKNGYFFLWQIENAFRHYKEAYKDFVLYINYVDSLDNEENTRASVQTGMLYEFSKQEATAKAEQDKKDLEYEAQTRQQKMITSGIIGGLAIVILFSGFLYNRFRITSRQKQIIEGQKLEVDQQKELAGERLAIAEKQKAMLEEKQGEILDSIRYAKRIQNSLLPSEKYIAKNLGRLAGNTK